MMDYGNVTNYRLDATSYAISMGIGNNGIGKAFSINAKRITLYSCDIPSIHHGQGDKGRYFSVRKCLEPLKTAKIN